MLTSPERAVDGLDRSSLMDRRSAPNGVNRSIRRSPSAKPNSKAICGPNKAACLRPGGRHWLPVKSRIGALWKLRAAWFAEPSEPSLKKVFGV